VVSWCALARARCRVSRAAAEARSNSAMGGEAAAPTSGVTGLNQAPRRRSEAEAERSRRRWAYDGVSPTGVRRDRSGDRTDRAEGGKRRHRSGAGAITKKVGGGRRSAGGSPPARRRRVAGEVERDRRALALGGRGDRGRVAAVADRGRRAGTGRGTGSGTGSDVDQSRCPLSESPISTSPSGKYSVQRRVTSAAVSGSQKSSFGYGGLMRASMTIGGV